MSLLQQATFYGCAVLAAFAVSLPQPRGDEKPSLTLSLDAPSIVNGVTDFTITGKLKNTGSQDVHVVRDPSGILYEFFTADALDIKKTDSEERDTAKPSFVGYRASWDMKTYLENNIEEDEYLPDDHPDVVSLSEDSESESHAKRGSSNSGSVESDTLSDTDTSKMDFGEAPGGASAARKRLRRRANAL